MQRTRIVERRILKNQSTKITMCCNNIISFFFLTKTISRISRLVFCCLTN
jgi:hypothetical protein